MSNAKRIETTLQAFGLNPECTKVAFVLQGEVTREGAKVQLGLVYTCSSDVLSYLRADSYQSLDPLCAKNLLKLSKKDKEQFGLTISIVGEGGLTHLIGRDELNRLLESITHQPELVEKYIKTDENE